MSDPFLVYEPNEAAFSLTRENITTKSIYPMAPIAYAIEGIGRGRAAERTIQIKTTGGEKLSSAKKYVVTEDLLRLFYDAKGKVADALYDRTRDSSEHEIAEDIWNDNVGASFEFLMKNMQYLVHVDVANEFDGTVWRNIEKYEEE